MGTLVMNEFPNNSLLEASNENDIVTRSRHNNVFEHNHRSGDISQGRQPQETDQIKTLADFSIRLCSTIAEQLLLHPCVVLRRQCQIHHTGVWYHLTPISLIQTLINIIRTQGSLVLWKGLGSVYVVHGISIMSETVVSEVTNFSREISRHMSLRKLGGHILLKGLVFAITTPFLAASLVETVQSDIVNERPNVLDILCEGALRFTTWGAPKTARQIPLWQLILPTVAFKLSHYTINSIAQSTVISSMHLEQQEVREQHGDGGRELSLYETYFPELLASFTGGVLADMIMFPLETVLHRLYVQGTRTIIDNTDTGIGVIPVNTHYESVIDCFKTIIMEEGLQGLYRGFGAFILQYAIHAAILRVVKLMFEQLSQDIASQHYQRRYYSDSPPSVQSVSHERGYGEGFSK